MTTFLLVGWRKAAFEAARAMHARIFLVAESEPPASVRDELSGWQVADFAPGKLDVDRILQGREDEPIDAVVALTERAVVPAALLREALELPGNSVQTARRCRDKALMKQAVRDAGLLCADWIEVTADTRPEDVIERLGLPLVIKQRDSSGSRGTLVASTRQEVEDALAPGWMAEQFLGGEEMSVESIVFDQTARFTNPTEYLKPGWANIVPAVLGDDERARLDTFNADVLAALGIERGISHLEVFRTTDQIYFGEVALRPPGGRLIDLISRAYGFDAWQAVLRAQFQEPVGLPERAERHTGIWFLHPGAGHLLDVTGVDEAEGITGVTEVKCRVKKGDEISRRVGTGQSVGHVMAEAPTRDALARTLVEATSCISLPIAR